MKAEDVLDPQWIETYKAQIEAIWWQLVALNTNIFLIGKIEDFRFDLFAPQSKTYWQITKTALIEASLMIIWRVIVDYQREALTLNKLKNEILRNVRPEIQDERKALKEYFDSSNFNTLVSVSEEQVREIRHKYLAHLNASWNTIPTPNRAYISRSDMQQLLNAAHRLFTLLCFNIERSLWYSDYSDYDPNVMSSEGRKPTSDIDELLEQIAKHSHVLNLPETDVEEWNYYRKELTEKDISVINSYRKNLNLPEVQ